MKQIDATTIRKTYNNEYHLAMKMFMNSDYLNISIPAYDEEEYCAEMLLDSSGSFWNVLTDGREMSISDGENIVNIWLRVITDFYGNTQINLPDDPAEAIDFLYDLGQDINIDCYLDSVGNDALLDDYLA